MRTLKGFLKPTIVGYLILLIGFVIAFQVGVNAREEGKRQSCLSIVEAYSLVADVVDIAIPPQTADQPQLDPTLPDSIKKLIEKSRKQSLEVRKRFEVRLNKPIPVCESVGIKKKIEIGKANNTTITYQAAPIPTVIIERGT